MHNIRQDSYRLQVALKKSGNRTSWKASWQLKRYFPSRWPPLADTWSGRRIPSPAVFDCILCLNISGRVNCIAQVDMSFNIVVKQKKRIMEIKKKLSSNAEWQLFANGATKWWCFLLRFFALQPVVHRKPSRWFMKEFSTEMHILMNIHATTAGSAVWALLAHYKKSNVYSRFNILFLPYNPTLA